MKFSRNFGAKCKFWGTKLKRNLNTGPKVIIWKVWGYKLEFWKKKFKSPKWGLATWPSWPPYPSLFFLLSLLPRYSLPFLSYSLHPALTEVVAMTIAFLHASARKTQGRPKPLAPTFQRPRCGSGTKILECVRRYPRAPLWNDGLLPVLTAKLGVILLILASFSRWYPPFSMKVSRSLAHIFIQLEILQVDPS